MKNRDDMIDLPVSKSIGARFLVATYFAGTLPADPYFDDNDDLLVLQQALLSLYSDEEPIDYGESPIDVHASGTAFRFVTAVCASTPGADFVITGTPRLCERPMQPLIEVLQQAGAKIRPQGQESLGPYRVTGQHLEGGEFTIRGDISSQFISALMLVGPTWKKGLKLNFSTPLVSWPYLEMTARVMKKFGIDVNLTEKYVDVKRGKYREKEGFRVEADWSSASFFYESCAISGEETFIRGLVPYPESMQGDSKIAVMFEKLGIKSEFNSNGVIIDRERDPENLIIELDFSDNPDIVLPYAVACLCIGEKFHFTGVSTLRHKECDRLSAIEKESAKLGYVVQCGMDSLQWEGEMTERINNPVISTYDDHRVAMSFAMAALATGEISIEDPDCVGKSFVKFWEELPKIGLLCERHGSIMKIKKQK